MKIRLVTYEAKSWRVDGQVTPNYRDNQNYRNN